MVKLEQGLRLLAFAGENFLQRETIVGILIILFFCSLSILLQADDWPAPQIRGGLQQNRRYFVPVTPGESLGRDRGLRRGENWQACAGSKLRNGAGSLANFRELDDVGHTWLYSPSYTESRVFQGRRLGCEVIVCAVREA